MTQKKFKIEVANRELSIEIRNLTEQANGSAFVRYGDTMVLATAVMAKGKREETNFFPLTVDYEERYYAAGKIKGPRYIKRESRPSDEAITTARLIDRTIRPRFPKELLQETQVVVTCLSWDAVNDPVLLGLIAASAALSVSDIPWNGPVAAVRVGRVDNQFVLNPTYEMREKSDLNLVFAAVSLGNEIILNMIDGDSNEADEETILAAFAFAKGELKRICAFQKEIAAELGKEKYPFEPEITDEVLEKEIKEVLGERLEAALFEKDKSARVDNVDFLAEELTLYFEKKYADSQKSRYVRNFFNKEISRLVHENAIKKNKRVDARKPDELREISMEVGLLPRTHGSGLFCRGETKALSILTLGAPGDQQILEGMEITGKKRFMHHYNFPPYSTGEVKPMRGPSRRDIGHGMLAEKALLPLVPSFDEFPYTIRIVTEILSSNGSTSMASVTSSSLALMDAGVPLKAPAAGISLGLMTDNQGNYKILTDIQGPEDHYGDMDFKVAGTAKGITAIQMDVKIAGISETIFQEALLAGKSVRGRILKEMEKVLAAPRNQLSPWAPRIVILQINPEKIREVIGPGGKVINEIIDETGVAIDIQDTGLIFITSEKEETAKKAVDWIKNITHEVKVGEIFQGKIKRILNFGAFAEILPGQEGLIHISQLAPYRVNRVEDVVKIGDLVPVKVIGIDEQGRINLSLKEAKKQEDYPANN
ncbi:MAG: polyribonucleotide nucleotidyltransferase [Candidatus Nealsonbacteria bacterium CG08_land_8_20_14_0_20_43_11]|uniref:Polyribonucleotide nucleotidyltransferase n=1 Tax=Candidatus Nealsonbacteria bacterium CG08_land_8_20_14_0_20_43_11 TaxID=1974706 RepID=A0A2M6T0Y1_9BACT|nr:MAG: polyribonucleotide nucleotidyltransferase [Candidatus Nealsonbacteria bacterium CG08_land_8_20_14_0_20_43_11]